MTYSGFMCITLCFLFMLSKRYIISHAHTLSDICVAARFYLPGSYNVQECVEKTYRRALTSTRASKFSRLAHDAQR